jgi:hypothetical protein
MLFHVASDEDVYSRPFGRSCEAIVSPATVSRVGDLAGQLLLPHFATLNLLPIRRI